MPQEFSEMPMCEECGKNPSIAFCCLREPDESLRWVFACTCTDQDDYDYVEFSRFFGRPSDTADCLANLHEKNWMDWSHFMEMMTRFRNALRS